MPGSTASRRKAVILVVDHDAQVRRVMVRALEHRGIGCLQAADIVAARWILNSRDVSAITLDIHSHGGRGLNLLQDVQCLAQDVPVLVTTAPEDTDTAMLAVRNGAVDYFLKPLNFQDIANRLHVLIDEQTEAELVYRHELESVIRAQTLAIHKAHEETVCRLVTASMYRDEETGEHIRRVGLHSSELARLANWSVEATEQIRLAAPMHDVGKIGIPDSILQKPGRLTDEEMSVMKTHTLIGAGMLEDSSSPMLQMARTIALCHHERWDGTGYPYGLEGLRIPAAARIVAIVDVFDALTHDRVYRPAMPIEKAISILNEGRCSHFDSLLLDLFLQNIDTFLQINHELPDRELSADEFARQKMPVAQLASGERVGPFKL